METQNNKKNKLILKIILGFIIGISFGFGIGKFIKSDSKLIASIGETIEENCNCERVKSNFGTVGLQFSKQDGFSTKKVDFVLKNCNFNISALNEANRLNEILKREVENYESVDLITFHFKMKNNTEIIKIKDGTVL